MPRFYCVIKKTLIYGVLSRISRQLNLRTFMDIFSLKIAASGQKIFSGSLLTASLTRGRSKLCEANTGLRGLFYEA